MSGLVKYTKGHQSEKQTRSTEQPTKENWISSQHEGNYVCYCMNRGEVGQDMTARLAVTFSYPIHDVQLTAKSLDGTADLQQLEPQSVIYGQTSRHPVREV